MRRRTSQEWTDPTFDPMSNPQHVETGLPRQYGTTSTRLYMQANQLLVAGDRLATELISSGDEERAKKLDHLLDRMEILLFGQKAFETRREETVRKHKESENIRRKDPSDLSDLSEEDFSEKHYSKFPSDE